MISDTLFRFETRDQMYWAQNRICIQAPWACYDKVLVDQRRAYRTITTKVISPNASECPQRGRKGYQLDVQFAFFGR